MKRKLIRTLGLLCSVAMLSTSVPFTVFADGAPALPVYPDFPIADATVREWDVNGFTVKLCRGGEYGSVPALVLDNTNVNVPSIDTSSSVWNSMLRSVRAELGSDKCQLFISSNLELGAQAFKGCEWLVSVNVIETEDKQFNIPAAGFSNCTSLETISGVEFIKQIQPQAFSGCTKFTGTSSDRFDLSESKIDFVGSEAFSGCTALTRVTMPEVGYQLEDHAFKGCTSLKYISNLSYCSRIGAGVFENDASEPIELEVGRFEIQTNGMPYVDLPQLILRYDFEGDNVDAHWEYYQVTWNIHNDSDTTLYSYPRYLDDLQVPAVSIDLSKCYLDEQYTQPVNASEPVKQDMVIYCNAVETIAVYYKSEGNDYKVDHVSSGAKLTKPEDPTREGYTFGGWYKDSDCTQAWNFDSDTVTAETTLYAKWVSQGSTQETVTIKYIAGGVEYTVQDVPAGSKITFPTAPTWEGYTFAGWCVDGTLTEKWDTNDVVGEAENSPVALNANSPVAFNANSSMTLYADWTPNNVSAGPGEHLVKFHPMGGSYVEAQAVVDNGRATEPETTRPGYKFKYWSFDRNGAERFYYFSDKITKDTWLFAQWEPDGTTMPPTQYTVTFNTQGGSAVATIGANAGSKITAPTTTRQGYTFGGWFKDAACTQAWDFANDTVNANITLYAKWTQNPAGTYTVSFSIIQNESYNPASVNVTSGSTVTRPTDPVKANNTFDGWYKDSNLTTKWNFATDAVFANTTLYGRFVPIEGPLVKKYTVTFDTQGGSAVASIVADENTTITAPANPTRAGYVFNGWTVDKAGTTSWDFSAHLVKNDMTLYAQWKVDNTTPAATYTVKFKTNGGSKIKDITVEEGELIAEPEAPKRAGHDFKGWFKEGALQNEWIFNEDTVDDNITLYAKWEAKEYTVKFNTNGGNSDKIESQTVKYGSTIEEPDYPTKTDYTFAGWCTSKDGSTEWDFESNKVTKNMTLYAKWLSDNLTVVFDSQGGSSVEAATVKRDTLVSQPSEPTKEGYIFGGWFKDAACTQAYSFSAKVTGDITLYAKWTTEEISIVFNTMGGNQVGVMKIAKGSTVPVPAVPVRAGYTFLGWYKDAECTQAWNFAIDKADENTMLYAKWLQGNVAKPQTGDEGIFSSISSGIYNFLKSINIL